MPYQTYTELTTPNRSDVTFNTAWRMLYAGGDTRYDNMDCVWFINGGQFSSHSGQSGTMSSDSLVITRNQWHPLWGGRTLNNVRAEVRGTMQTGYWGPWLKSPTLQLRPPALPKVEITSTYGATEDEVKVNVTIPSATAAQERYDTVFTVTRNDSSGAKSTLHNVTSTDTSLSYTANISTSEAILSNDGWIEIVASARSRGLAGDSNTVTKKHILAWPATPQITDVVVTGELSDGMVMVSCNTNASYYHPVDSVQLQIKHNSTAETAAQAMDPNFADEATWTDVSGALDDGDCVGLSHPLIDAYPSRGKRTWYRIKSSHGPVSFTRYSLPAMLPIFNPAAVPGAADIHSAISGDDGESAEIDIVWADDEADETQVSWATTKYAWEATSGTTEFSFTWEDATPITGFDHSARVYISGLDQNTTYYVRTRRVIAGDVPTYGAWSGIFEVTPVSAPEWVELNVPGVIARGESLPVSWTFGSDAAQKSWRLLDSDGKVWASGDDADGATTIPASSLDGINELSLMVTLTTGGEWKSSDFKNTIIAERPECSITLDSTITEQPVEVEVFADVPGEVSLTVASSGTAYERPDKTYTQYAGDIIYAQATTPVWTAVTGGYSATVVLPTIELINGTSYTVAGTVKDTSTGLVSPESFDTFVVAWEHLAAAPSAVATPNVSKLSVALVVSAPEDAAETDVCDVYRVTPDGADLIAEGVTFGYTVTDRFAPYSKTAETVYRIATRTADGDVAWTDVDYTLEGTGVRLDWGNESMVLPYNIGLDERIGTSFEARKHMDGVTEGFWNEGSTKSVRLTTDMIRVDRETQDVLRSMARYTGAVFVRAANGTAYDADVTLDTMTEAYSSGTVAVSLTCTAVALTSAHKCSSGDVVA